MDAEERFKEVCGGSKSTTALTAEAVNRPTHGVVHEQPALKGFYLPESILITHTSVVCRAIEIDL